MSEERLAKIEATQAAHGVQLADIKVTLSQLVQMMARIDGRLQDAPTSRDFGRLEGELSQIGQRILDLNSRLPVPIAYSPPEPRRAGTG